MWDALLQRMPMTAMVRNLGKMTSLSLVKPFSDAKKLVLRKLNDETALKRSRIDVAPGEIWQQIAVLWEMQRKGEPWGSNGAIGADSMLASASGLLTWGAHLCR